MMNQSMYDDIYTIYMIKVVSYLNNINYDEIDNYSDFGITREYETITNGSYTAAKINKFEIKLSTFDTYVQNNRSSLSEYSNLDIIPIGNVKKVSTTADSNPKTSTKVLIITSIVLLLIVGIITYLVMTGKIKLSNKKGIFFFQAIGLTIIVSFLVIYSFNKKETYAWDFGKYSSIHKITDSDIETAFSNTLKSSSNLTQFNKFSNKFYGSTVTNSIMNRFTATDNTSTNLLNAFSSLGKADKYSVSGAASSILSGISLSTKPSELQSIADSSTKLLSNLTANSFISLAQNTSLGEVLKLTGDYKGTNDNEDINNLKTLAKLIINFTSENKETFTTKNILTTLKQMIAMFKEVEDLESALDENFDGISAFIEEYMNLISTQAYSVDNYDSNLELENGLMKINSINGLARFNSYPAVIGGYSEDKTCPNTNANSTEGCLKASSPIMIGQAILKDGSTNTKVTMIQLEGTNFAKGQADGIITDILAGFENQNQYLTAVQDAIEEYFANYSSEEPSKKLYITGFSLGGMIAQLLITSDDFYNYVTENNMSIEQVTIIASPYLNRVQRETDKFKNFISADIIDRIFSRYDLVPFAGKDYFAKKKGTNGKYVLDKQYPTEGNSYETLHTYGKGQDVKSTTCRSYYVKESKKRPLYTAFMGTHNLGYAISQDIWGDYDVRANYHGTNTKCSGESKTTAPKSTLVLNYDSDTAITEEGISLPKTHWYNSPTLLEGDLSLIE